MLTIKEGATELFSDTHKTVYFFTGQEYGVKKEYIDKLSEQFNYSIENYDSFQSIIDSCRNKPLFIDHDTLYIVRYDKQFISSLNNKLENDVNNLRPHGIIIGLYEDEKDENKLDKHFSDRVIRFNLMSKEVEANHLYKDFENLPPNYISASVNMSSNYYQAYNICYAMTFLKDLGLSQPELFALFGYDILSNEEHFKLSVASKDFKAAIREVDRFDGLDLSTFHYAILSVLLDIAKCKYKSNPNSYVYKYVKRWDIKELNYLYNEVIDQIEKLRNYSTYDSYISIVYLLGLLNFKVS